MFTGGNQSGGWGNEQFVAQFVAGKGTLGTFFCSQLEGTLKMGDSPSVGWLLGGSPADPSQPGWGGQFVRAWTRPYVRLDRLTTADDQMEVFGILELVLPLGENAPEKPEVWLEAENQSLPGYALGDGTLRFRFCPKAATTYEFKREVFLQDFAVRMRRCTAPKISQALPASGLGAADQPVLRTDENSQVAHAQLLEKARKGGIDVCLGGLPSGCRWGRARAQP